MPLHADRVDLPWCLESRIRGDSRGLLESSSLLSSGRESAPHLSLASEFRVLRVHFHEFRLFFHGLADSADLERGYHACPP